MKQYECTACGWVYNPSLGDPDGGIPPGTPFDELGTLWVCPGCGLGIEYFEEIKNPGI